MAEPARRRIPWHTGGTLIGSAAPPPVPGRKPNGSGGVTDKPDAIGELAAAALSGQGDAEAPGDAVRIAPAAPATTLPPAPPIPPALLGKAINVTPHGAWAIQVGAYATRAATEQAIQQAIRRAPQLLRDATVVIMEIPNHKKTLYRARLSGLLALDAHRACKMLAHCQTVPPGAL